MLGYVFSVIVLISVACGLFTGNLELTSEAAFGGASKAVTVILSLVGAMCLWSGILEVLREAHILRGFTRLLRPILRLLFPDASKKENGVEEMCAAIAANILGMGNAATPMALCAMEKLSENSGNSERASDDMITFAVLCTATFALFPTTVISLRAAAGSENPFLVIVPVWITSALGTVAATFFSKALRIFGKRRGELL